MAKTDILVVLLADYCPIYQWSCLMC